MNFSACHLFGCAEQQKWLILENSLRSINYNSCPRIGIFEVIHGWENLGFPNSDRYQCHNLAKRKKKTNQRRKCEKRKHPVMKLIIHAQKGERRKETKRKEGRKKNRITRNHKWWYVITISWFEYVYEKMLLIATCWCSLFLWFHHQIELGNFGSFSSFSISLHLLCRISFSIILLHSSQHGSNGPEDGANHKSTKI